MSCWMEELRKLFPSLAQESQKGRHIRSVLVLRRCRSLPLVQEPNPRLGSSSSHLERQVIEIISCWMGKLRELFSKYKKKLYRNFSRIHVKLLKRMVAWNLYPKCYNCHTKWLMNKLVGHPLVKITDDGIIQI